jgi:hypothetical protein
VQSQNKHDQDRAQWGTVGKDWLPVAGKKNMGVISKVIPTSNQGSMGILFWKPIKY